ncbi:bifunctional lysylphosphatidylglycerol flippase/synthetase MprF [Nocardia rhizosphaerihabitans]|uniref:bifunctional lysylphosphatidylglycerol flippase/synthetase MprF n=1 Tax=Nocardia rhizosphaerihabitans TaxID=1691570 RepID=UPI003671A118
MNDNAAATEPGALAVAGTVLRRVPFTIAFLVLVAVLGVATGGLWRRLDARSWFPDIAYGWLALTEGRWWTPLSGWFFGLTPFQYLVMALFFALAVGWTEWRLGTARTALVCVSGHLIGVLGASVTVGLLAPTHLGWADRLAEARDVGFTTAAIAALAAVSATLRSPWRLRVRAVLVAHVSITFLFESTFADLMHVFAVAAWFPLGEKLFSRTEHGFWPRTRREVRMLGSIGLLLIAAVSVLVYFFPADSLLGPTENDRGSLWSTILTVVVIAAIADQLRKGRRWAWWVAVAYGTLHVVLTLITLGVAIGVDYETTGAVTVGTALLWAGEVALLYGGRGAFRVPARRKITDGALSDADPGTAVRALLARYGGSTMSWMTTWPENKYWFAADGERFVAYQRHASTVIALTDPVGPPDLLPDTIARFTDRCESDGLVPCLFSTTATVADLAGELGWRSVQIAEDTIVDLAQLEFKGKAWQDIRSAINKANKEGIEFRMVHLAEEPFAVLAQVRAISEEWVGEKGLPEMGFTLGGVEEALDPAVRVGLAIDAGGSVHGVTSWLPVYAPGGEIRGWTLDVMRRRPDGFRPVVEFLIASACRTFKEEGAEIVSLSGAPLARSAGADGTEPIDRLLEGLGAAMEPYYGFRSLHAFKAKFLPRHEPVFLCYRDEADLPRIGIALTKAYLPEASAKDLMALGASTH